ncbi:MAG: PAS domain S-box protein, partial [Melioribacteraceae bacterium]
MKKNSHYKNSDPAGSHDEWRESIVENAPALICRHLKDTTLTYVNETMCRFFNLPKKQLLGRKLIDWVAEEDRSKVYELIGNLSAGEDSYSLEFGIKKGEKDLRFIDWNYSTIRIATGEMEIQSLGIDITDRKLAELKLAESERSYHQLFNTISEAIFVMNGEGVVLEANFGVQKMYGYERDELIGRTPEFLSAPSMNDLLKVYDLFRSTFETGIIHSFDFWGLKKNGEAFPNVVTIHRGNYSGKDVIISITRDATEQKKIESILKESEERYKSIFQNSAAVMLVLDAETLEIVDANNSACVYYGYSKEKLTSLKITSINVLPDEKLRRELLNATSKGKYHFLFQHRLANSSIRDVEVYSGPVEFHGRKHLYSIIHDITEKKKAEDELRLERDLFISGPVITVKWNARPELSIAYISPNVSEILGYPAEDFIKG